MTKINGYLPIFTGFYESRWDIGSYELDRKIDDWKDEDGLSDEAIEKRTDAIQWRPYYEKLSSIICEEIGDALKEYVPGIKSVTFEKLSSPSYYNYSNDSIYCNYEIDGKVFGKFFRNHIKTHADKWNKFLDDNFKSRSGFSSFFPYNANEWHKHTKGFTSFGRKEPVWFVECLEFLAETLKESDLTTDHLYERAFERAVCNGNCMISDFIPAQIWNDTSLETE